VDSDYLFDNCFRRTLAPTKLTPRGIRVLVERDSVSGPGPPEEKQQLKKMVEDQLKALTEGVTSGTPDRAWYSISSKGLLEAAKFVKDFSGEIGGTLKNLGSSFWLLAGFQADGHFAVIGPHPCTRQTCIVRPWSF
jgi:hypothetical protein